MSQHSEQPNHEGRTARRSSRSQQTTAIKRRTAKRVEEPVESEANSSPPRKTKNEALILKHYRLRAVDVKQTEAVSKQRKTDQNDIVRKQYERGVNVDSALGAPGEDGLYGLYKGERLAELLLPDIDGLISFALRHGVVPTVIQEYRQTFQGLRSPMGANPVGLVTPLPPGRPGSQQPEPMAYAPVTEVAEEADGVLGIFFGGAGNDSEETGGSL